MAPSREVIAADEETLTRQSRSFAIPILKLDNRFRHAVMVEYNLNKTVDTIEDSVALDRKEKAQFTEEFCDALEREVVPEDVRERMLAVTPAAESFVFENWDATMALFRSLGPGERELAKKWTAEMARGMSGFQEKRIETGADLNDYCYYVAGTVGMYLTGLLRLKGEGVTDGLCENLQEKAVHFGLFLQKLNVIRDVVEDTRVRGRSFWPREYSRPDRDRLDVLNTMCYEALKNNLPGAIDYATRIPPGNESYEYFLRFILSSGMEYLRILKNNPSVFSRLKVKLSGIFVRQLYRQVSALTLAEFGQYCDRLFNEESAYYQSIEGVGVGRTEPR